MSPRTNYVQSKRFLDCFVNRMSTTNVSFHFTHHPFHKPSGWTTLNIFSPISNIDNPITERTHIPSQLMNALHQIHNDPNIIIKPADKGGATVVLNKQDYNDKVLHILSDKTFYRQRTHNHTILHEVQSLIDHLHIKGRTDDKIHAFLSP